MCGVFGCTWKELAIEVTVRGIVTYQQVEGRRTHVVERAVQPYRLATSLALHFAYVEWRWGWRN